MRFKLEKVDEHPRETSLDKLGKLKTVFKVSGTVTVGNAALKRGYKPKAQIIA
nr:hypothetical protein [Lentibacillus populi]